jgi:hypothetical protein
MMVENLLDAFDEEEEGDRRGRDMNVTPMNVIFFPPDDDQVINLI